MNNIIYKHIQLSVASGYVTKKTISYKHHKNTDIPQCAHVDVFSIYSAL